MTLSNRFDMGECLAEVASAISFLYQLGIQRVIQFADKHLFAFGVHYPAFSISLCRELLPLTIEFDAGSSRKPYSEFGIAPDKRSLFIQTAGMRSYGSGRVTNRRGAFPDGAVLETCITCSRQLKIEVIDKATFQHNNSACVFR